MPMVSPVRNKAVQTFPPLRSLKQPAGAHVEPERRSRSRVVLTFAFVALVGICGPLAWLVSRAFYNVPTPGNRLKPFCCTEHVPILFGFMNGSFDPCRNFFAYSCDNAVQQRYRNPYAQTGEVIVTLMQTSSVPDFPATKFFSTYFLTCTKDGGRQIQLIDQITVALMNLVGVPYQKSSMELFSAVFDLGVKRNVPYAFRFKVPRPEPRFFDSESNSNQERRRFRMYRNHLTLDGMTKCSYCVVNSLALYNKRYSLNVSLEEVMTFDRGIPGLVPSSSWGPFGTATTKARYTKVSKIGELYRHLPFLDEASLRNTFDGTVLEVDESTTILHSEDEAIFDVVSYLLSPDQHPVSLAHLIVYTTSTTFSELYIKARPTQSREKVVRSLCLNRALSHDQLWNMVYAVSLTDAAKDRFVREAFAEARKAVRSQVRSGIIVSHEDQAIADRLLYGVTLVLPRERYVVDFEPPQAREFLVENYLSVTEFEYRVLMEQARRMIPEEYPPVWTTGKHMAIDTDFYRFLQVSYKPSAIPNLPVSVFRLAVGLWALLLNSTTWSAPTTRNVRAFMECYGKAHWSRNGSGTTLWYDEPETPLTSAAAALALRSVRAAVRDADDWRVLKVVSKGARMSHAQFFYAMFASMFCNWNANSSIDAASTNAPLSHVPDFAETFACTRNSLMVAKECCQCF